MENISKIVFNSLHNSIIQMRNLVYGLTRAPTMEQSGLISIVVGVPVWFIHRHK